MDNLKKIKNIEELDVYTRWRRKILFVGLICAICICIIEIFYYFIYYLKDDTLVNGLDNAPYLIFFLFIPTITNFSVIIGGMTLNNNPKIKEKSKNYIVSFAIVLMTGMTMSVHYVFPPLLSAVCIAIFMTTIFGDKRLTIYITLVALLFVLVSFLKAKGIYFIKEVSGYFKDDPNLTYNYIIGLVAIFCSYIGSRVIIIYQKEKSNEIIEIYQKQSELHELLRLDSLTKLYNHSSIYEIIEENLVSHKNFDQFNLAMIDIDNFKKVNDNYGHIHGDEVLAELARILRKYSSDNIVCARYGGEEFAILFINYNENDACRILEKISKEFSEFRFSFIEEGNVTFSCGVTSLSSKNITPSEFFHQADTALYQAKAAGKNCIARYQKK